MTKRNAILLALSTLVIGLAMGAWTVCTFGLMFIQSTYESSLMAEARTRVYVLKALQASDIKKAVQQLESGLDGDVIGLAGILDKGLEPEKLRATLTLVARYRQGTQYVSAEPTVASHVHNALKPFYEQAP
ncbi:hypothetical protein [Ralstonia flatus]|uniref:Uncharacterized protein n=1 Tax=Ralstonia flatus TaxID=3058601 RepID=A0AAD2FA33_9RALS|nr:hypothetical protein [Ralstonia sp. LMG 32965]MBN6207783.1 hypothetical protein [Ralstonia pickettii]CAJ0887847.1 hypothetical protein R77567_03969 [Ralstonia sp. LMG 32965]CAJ0900410.1 hypothetical protein R77564_04444 [Ralstonia sp. LMG 32965]